MAANALIQTRIDAAVKEQASTVLESMGLTVSDAVRILLTRVAKEGALPAGLTAPPEAYDAWFKAKVIEALNDTSQTYSHEEVSQHFSKKREALTDKSREI
jgi:DNA-damage-inducible protein J